MQKQSGFPIRKRHSTETQFEKQPVDEEQTRAKEKLRTKLNETKIGEQGR